MAATYPLAVKTFTQKRNLFEDVDASHVNDMQDEIRAIQNVLGLRPNVDGTTGESFASVAARLDSAKKNVAMPAFDLWTTGYVKVPVQSWVGGTWTTMGLSVAELDTDGLSDGSGMTVKKRGIYFLTASAYFWASMVWTTRHVGLSSSNFSVDGSDIITWGSLNGLNGAPAPPGVTGQVNCNWLGILNPGNQMKVKVISDRGGNASTNGDTRVSRGRLQGFMLREV